VDDNGGSVMGGSLLEGVKVSEVEASSLCCSRRCLGGMAGGRWEQLRVLPRQPAAARFFAVFDQNVQAFAPCDQLLFENP
jgi:hypothetical protein